MTPEVKEKVGCAASLSRFGKRSISYSILVGRRRHHVPRSFIPTSPTSISEEDASHDLCEGSETVLDSSNPIPDILTTSADQSVSRMTSDTNSETALDSLTDLGLESESGAVDPEWTFDHHPFLTPPPSDTVAPIVLDGPTNLDTLPACIAISSFPTTGDSHRHATSNSRKPDAEDRQPPTWRTILTLDNVQLETLNSIMQIVIQSRTKVTLESHL